MQARKLDDFVAHNALYGLAFLAGDEAAMTAQQQWLAANAGVENFGFSLTSDTEAYDGHLAKALELTKRSVDSAIHADSKESGAIWLQNAALPEAAFGNFPQARQAAEAGLKLDPASQGVVSWLSGRTPTPISRFTSRPRPSTPNCSSGLGAAVGNAGQELWPGLSLRKMVANEDLFGAAGFTDPFGRRLA